MTTLQRPDLIPLIDMHGADLSVWPSDLRRAAEQLIATDAEAARQWRAAQQFEGLMRHALRPVDPAAEQTRALALAERIVARLPGAERDRLIHWLWPRRASARLANAVLMATLPLALGFTLGSASANSMWESQSETSQVWSEQLLALPNGEEWDLAVEEEGTSGSTLGPRR